MDKTLRLSTSERVCFSYAKKLKKFSKKLLTFRVHSDIINVYTRNEVKQCRHVQADLRLITLRIFN